jgi:filamentous hemagglutinin
VGWAAAFGAITFWPSAAPAISSVVANNGRVGVGQAVYRSVDASGVVRYIGITNNLSRRAAEHLRKSGIQIGAIPGLNNLTRQQARAVEQALIEAHGLGRNGGTLLNRINSIARTNPEYAELLRQGRELLRSVGYPGI